MKLLAVVVAVFALVQSSGEDAGFRYNNTKKGCFNAQGQRGYNVGFLATASRNGECTDLSAGVPNQLFIAFNLKGAKLTKLKLQSSSFAEARLDGADLTMAVLSGKIAGGYTNATDFRKANLTHAKLNGVTADDALFGEAVLNDAAFFAARLRRADFRAAQLVRTVLDNSDLQDAQFDNAVMDAASLEQAILTHVSFERASLKKASLKSSNLDGVNLQYTQMAGALLSFTTSKGLSPQFLEADLTGANFFKAKLAKPRMVKTILKGANLKQIVFDTAWLQEADLTDADLSGASLQRSSLVRANLTNADLRGADLTACVVTDTIMTGAKYNAATTLPFSESVAKSRGMVRVQ